MRPIGAKYTHRKYSDETEFHEDKLTGPSLFVCLRSVFDGACLPDSGRRVPAHQLLQLQLLVLRRPVHCWADLPTLARA